MKTALEWFRTLPEEECIRAIANTSSSRLERYRPSLEDALSCSFSWSDSKEGGDYWEKIHDRVYVPFSKRKEESHADLLDVAKQTLVMLNNQNMCNSVFAKQVNLAIDKATKIK